jgi:hypothetical protein
MSIDSNSDYTEALVARVAKYEYLKSKLGRPPTDAELGPMPTPGEVELILGELEEFRRREKANKLPKPKKWTRPAPEVERAAMIARSQARSLNTKARNNGLIGVVKRSCGSWTARFTPPNGYGCKSYTAAKPTMEEAIEARNEFVRRHYGDTRPWLFAEYKPTAKRKRA